MEKGLADLEETAAPPAPPVPVAPIAAAAADAPPPGPVERAHRAHAERPSAYAFNPLTARVRWDERPGDDHRDDQRGAVEGGVGAREVAPEILGRDAALVRSRSEGRSRPSNAASSTISERPRSSAWNVASAATDEA